MVRVVTMRVMNIQHEHSSLIDRLGGTTKVASICKVRSQAVSRWRRDGIPPARFMYLEAIYPDVIRGKQAAA